MFKGKIMLTREELLRLFTYDPITGELYWNYREECSKTWNTRFAGKIINNPTPEGYKRAMINGKMYKAHHIVWTIIYGVWPDHIVDHEDNNTGNNRELNLRKATKLQNNHNHKKRITNTSGYKGVTEYRPGRYRVSITCDGIRYNLGCFDDIEKAHEAYVNAASKYHKEFACIN